jgi:hypothetical protein
MSTCTVTPLRGLRRDFTTTSIVPVHNNHASCHWSRDCNKLNVKGFHSPAHCQVAVSYCSQHPLPRLPSISTSVPCVTSLAPFWLPSPLPLVLDNTRVYLTERLSSTIMNKVSNAGYRVAPRSSHSCLLSRTRPILVHSNLAARNMLRHIQGGVRSCLSKDRVGRAMDPSRDRIKSFLTVIVQWCKPRNTHVEV